VAELVFCLFSIAAQSFLFWQNVTPLHYLMTAVKVRPFWEFGRHKEPYAAPW
jgi:hypothetical protein